MLSRPFRPLGSGLLRDPRDVRIGSLGECGDSAIVGVPWDWKTGGDPGARHAPRAIIGSFMALRPHAPSGRDVQCRPALLGEVAVAGGDWERTSLRIREAAALAFDRFRFTVFVGGDHSITGPILEALLERGSVGLLMLDAHYDLRTVEEGVTSGDWLWSVAKLARERLGYELHAAIVGVADYQNPPYLAERAERLGFMVVPASHVWSSPEPALEAVDKLRSTGASTFYITVDMDHIAEPYAPGVNSPSPLGVPPWVTAKILDHAVSRLSPAGADIVEVVPVKDVGGRTVRLAAQLMARLFGGAGVGRQG